MSNRNKKWVIFYLQIIHLKIYGILWQYNLLILLVIFIDSMEYYIWNLSLYPTELHNHSEFYTIAQFIGKVLQYRSDNSITKLLIVI